MTPLSILNILPALLIPLFIGNTAIRSLFHEPQQFSSWFRWAVAYGLGTGFLSLWFLILGLFDIPFNNVYLVSVPPLLASLLLHARAPFQNHLTSAPARTKISRKQISLLSILLIAYIVSRLLMTFTQSIAEPMGKWDAIATWGYNAKVFFYDGSFFQMKIVFGSYPLLVPFSQTWIALHLGTWDDHWVKLFFPCLFLSYVLIQHHYLKNETDNLRALTGTAILLSSIYYTSHVSTAYADTTISYFFCSTIIFFLSWMKTRQPGWLILAGFFSGFASFTKLEGTPYLLIHTLILIDLIWRKSSLDWKEKVRNTCRFMIPGFSIGGVFHLYKIVTSAKSTPKEQFVLSGSSALGHSWAFLEQLFKNLIYVENWNLCWWLVLLGMVIFPGKVARDPRLRIILMSLILFVLFYLTAANVTGASAYLGGSETSLVLPRLLIHIFPLAPLFISLLYVSELNQEKMGKK